MTPQGRTDLNNTLKHYEHLIKMDAKTQDRYEGEISMLQRQINDLSGKLQLADGAIKKSMEDDEETPLPLLHMMERTAQAEKLYEDLRRDIIGAVIDCPDYCAMCDIGYDLWQTTCPPDKDQKTKEQIQDYMMDDVIEKNDLTTEDDFGDAYDNGYNAGKEEMEEYYDEQIDTLKEELSANQAILQNYRDEMTKIEELAGTEVEDIVDVAGYIKCLQEALKIVKDENEVNKKNLSQFIADKHALKGQLEHLKGKFRKDLDEMAEAMAVPLKRELAEAQKKCRGLEKVIEDTTGWGTFIEELDEKQINNLREAGYPECDITTEEEEELAYDLLDEEETERRFLEVDWEAKGLGLSGTTKVEERPENPAFTFFPDLKKVPKMEKFMNQGGHIKMEKADMTGNTKWMDECAKRGYLEAMKTHRKMTGSCFEWECFDEWVKDK